MTLYKIKLAVTVVCFSLSSISIASCQKTKNDQYQQPSYAQILNEKHSDFIALQRLAEQGDTTAQFDLGVAYENGQGVAQNYAKAIELYTKAAGQGDSDAQNNLGRMYDEGKGVDQIILRLLSGTPKRLIKVTPMHKTILVYCISRVKA